MRSTEDFLTAIWPVSGRKAIVSIRNGDVQHYWFDDVKDAAAKAQELAQSNIDAYYSVAGFSSDERKSKNAVALKALFLDIDIGEGPTKNYPNTTQALNALSRFCVAVDVPTPVIVSSGIGLHVYWVLDHEVNVATWTQMAENLKSLCREHGLSTDVKCTADAARILRPVGTFNYKNGSPHKVKVASVVLPTPVGVEEIRLALKVVPQDMFAQVKAAMPEGADTVQTTEFNNNAPSDLDVVMAHCATIRWAYENQAVVSEPLWHDVLGVAGLTRGGEADAHRISCEHPGYDRAATAKKHRERANGAGPTTCVQFRTDPQSQCAGCPQTCGSPIQLGRPKNVVSFTTTMTPAGVERFSSSQLKHDGEGYYVNMPAGKPDKDGNQHYDWIKISKHALTPLLELRQPDAAGIPSNYVWLESYNDVGKVLNSFVVPSQGIANSMQFSNDCSKQGYYFESESEPGAYRKYHKIMRTWVEEMKQRQGSIVTFRSFGWTGADSATNEKQTAFLHGNTLYTPTGQHTAPRTATLASFQEDMVCRGTLEEWIAAMDNYNLPGMEAQMYATWIAWGSPLMRFTQSGTGIFHLTGDTGVGKSSLQRAIISAYGDYNSKLLLDVNNSTLNSMGKTMGLLNSLPYLKEELTEADADELSSWALTATQGREKQRMNQNNGIAAVSTWSLIACTSANQSLREIIVTHRQDSAARLARVWEQNITLPMEQHEASRLFAPLKRNYGWAGPIYFDYIVCNEAEVAELVRQTEEKLSIMLKAKGSDRFHISQMAANIVGVQLATELGLTHHDIARGTKFAVRQYHRLRSNAVAEKHTPEQTLARFMQEMQPQTLVVEVDAPGTASTLFNSENNIIRNVSQNNPITMRYARLPATFYATKTVIRRWYAENHVAFEQDMQALESAGILLDRDKRLVLTKGTKLSDGKQVGTLWFDLSKSQELVEAVTMEGETV